MAQNNILQVNYINGDISVYDIGSFVSSLPFGESLMNEIRVEFSEATAKGSEGLFCRFWYYRIDGPGHDYGKDA
jgi:hypothetical protein